MKAHSVFQQIFMGQSIFHNVVFALIYIFFFDYMWENFESVVFSYEGIIYNGDVERRIIGYIVALIPVLFYRGLRQISSWVALLIYYFGYVPCIMGLCLDLPSSTNHDVNSYYIVLCFAQIFFFLSDKSRKTINISSEKKLSLNILWFVTIILTLILFLVFRNNMRFAGFQEIYTLREENANVDVAGIGYIYSWCSSFFYPFVFCYGLIKKNKKMMLIGGLLFVFLFMVMGQKADLFAPLIIMVLYYAFKWQERTQINLMAFFSVGIFAVSVVLFLNINTDWGLTVGSLLFSRTIGVSAYHMPMYLDFFAKNPYTYYSHANFINAFTDMYPYSESIGKMVSETGSNSNAIFWQMDGIAACGVIGVALISMVVYMFLLYLNGLSNQKSKVFVCTMILIPVIALLNVSFFTTMVTKGVFLLFLAVWFLKIPYEDETNNYSR